MRVRVEASRQDGEFLHLAFRADRPIDPRALRLFNAPTFSGARGSLEPKTMAATFPSTCL
jgi:hypothetical protein